MSGAIPPLPQYAFMAWLSVKAQGQIYLYIYRDAIWERDGTDIVMVEEKAG
jgi:hypothetical protein